MELNEKLKQYIFDSVVNEMKKKEMEYLLRERLDIEERINRLSDDKILELIDRFLKGNKK